MEVTASGRFAKGLTWFPEKRSLIENAPKDWRLRPIVAESCMKPSAPKAASQVFKSRKSAGMQLVKRYAFVESHDCLRQLSQQQRPTNFFEVLHYESPRSLYFDLDGAPVHRAKQEEILDALTSYVEKEFEQTKLRPVVKQNKDAKKFSCHVIFPEIQFADHAHQTQYVPRLVNNMPDFLSILGEVVDPIPYSKFQLLRAPWAAKLSTENMRLQSETMFEPTPMSSELYEEDPNIVFASYCGKEYRRTLPPPKPFIVNFNNRSLLRGVGQGLPSCLFVPEFTQLEARGLHLFPQLDPVGQLREALALLHPKRASHYYSWLKITGIVAHFFHDTAPVCTLQEWTRFSDEEFAKRNPEVLELFYEWSSQYPDFNEYENLKLLRQQHIKTIERRINGWFLLRKMLLFDNPNKSFPQLEEDSLGSVCEMIREY